MKKAEFTNEVAELLEGTEFELKKKDLTVVIDTVFDAIYNALLNGEEVTLGALGKLTTVERAARKGRNPSDGTEIEIPATVVPKYKPSKTIKNDLKQN